MIVVTTCPLCHINFKDAIKVLGLENKILAKDLMELVLEAL
jgi:Fe-S oxidoreductase